MAPPPQPGDRGGRRGPPGPPLAVGRPLERAYSHRDCELAPPLARSLEQGFTHVEVDVFCVAGRLLVAHDARRLGPGAGLRRLYLEPLRELAASSGGRVFEDGRQLWLHLDIKTAPAPAFRAALRLHGTYPELIAAAPGDGKPVRLVLSGNRPPPPAVAALRHRTLTLDGRAPDLGRYTDAGVMPIISDDWRGLFAWRGDGAMPADEARRLDAMVTTAHAHGQLLRFWGTPDDPGPERERVWTHLLRAGVDLLNTDDVVGLRTFLDARQVPPGT